MLAPYRSSHVRPARPASALGAPIRSMEQLNTSSSSIPNARHRLSRPLSQELERLAEFIEEDSDQV